MLQTYIHLGGWSSQVGIPIAVGQQIVDEIMSGLSVIVQLAAVESWEAIELAKLQIQTDKLGRDGQRVAIQLVEQVREKHDEQDKDRIETSL